MARRWLKAFEERVRTGRSKLDGKTFQNLLMYAAYQALRYIAPVVLTPFLAHALHKEQFADLVVLNSCIWTSTVFMEFGFYLYGVSKTAAAASREELSRTVTAITAGKILLAPIALLAYVALAGGAGLLARNPTIVAIGALSAIGYGGSFAWFFQGQQRGGTAVLTEAVPQGIYYALVLIFVRGPGDLWLAALTQTIPPLISISVSFLLVHRSGLLGRFDFSAVRCVMSEALPYFVERFCFTLYTAITPALVAVLSIASQAAYYSIGDRFSQFLGTLSIPIFQAVVPFVAKTVRRQGGGWRLSLSLVAAVTVFVGASAVVTFLAAGLVITRFFSSDFAPAIVVARICCVNSVIAVLGMAFANLVIIPRNAARVMIWSSTAALIVGMAAQVIWVPTYGAVGAAFSRGASETIVTIVLGIVVIQMIMRDMKARLPLQERPLGAVAPVFPSLQVGPEGTRLD
jgi:PST family polysaccharide transporter